MDSKKQLCVFPLVTVIITAYNHEKYVGECLDSVIHQTYAHIQIILINNGSSDQTHQQILPYVEKFEDLQYISNCVNKGLCAAFNQGLKYARGKYVVDLSADDLLLQNRIERQVALFENLPIHYGVIFSNAIYCDEEGHFIKNHYPVDADFRTIDKIPSGAIFKNIIEKYFICTPTMMMRTEVFKILNGYDESLSFEDFDFWVRSSILFNYQFQDEILTIKRDTSSSLGKQILDVENKLLLSYLIVSQKAYARCGCDEELEVLANRIRSFIRKCLYAEHYQLAFDFGRLLSQIQVVGINTGIILFLCRMKIPVNKLYRFLIQFYSNKYR